MRPNKLLFLFLILSTSSILVTCQTVWSDAFLYWSQMSLVKEGSFEALFKDSARDPGNSCWNAFNLLRETYAKTPTIDSLLTISQFFIVLKRYHEFGAVVYKFYWACDFETVNVELGKRSTSISGIVDLLIGAAFTYMNEIGSASWQRDVESRIETANYSGNEEDWKKVGEPVGELVANFLRYQVPSYDFNYGNYTRNLS